MKFKLGCQLNYDIDSDSDSTFIFNIRAIENEYQQILYQSLKIQPDCEPEEYSKDGENSYFRLIVPSGKLKLDYQAEVDINSPCK